MADEQATEAPVEAAAEAPATLENLDAAMGMADAVSSAPAEP